MRIVIDLLQTGHGESYVSRKRVITDLKASCERIGRLHPTLLDRHGNVIDGRHRLAADENWPKIRLENVETEEDRLIARLISNTCRRHVPAEGKTEMLERLGRNLSWRRS